MIKRYSWEKEQSCKKKKVGQKSYFLRQKNIFLPLTIYTNHVFIHFPFIQGICLLKEFVYQRRERKTSASLENKVFLYLCTLWPPIFPFTAFKFLLFPTFLTSPTAGHPACPSPVRSARRCPQRSTLAFLAKSLVSALPITPGKYFKTLWWSLSRSFIAVIAAKQMMQMRLIGATKWNLLPMCRTLSGHAQ